MLITLCFVLCKYNIHYYKTSSGWNTDNVSNADWNGIMVFCILYSGILNSGILYFGILNCGCHCQESLLVKY